MMDLDGRKPRTKVTLQKSESETIEICIMETKYPQTTQIKNCKSWDLE